MTRKRSHGAWIAMCVMLVILSACGRLDREQAAALLENGDRALAEGRLGEAEADFRRVADAFPEEARAHAGVGIALVRAGRHGEGIAPLEAALEIEPDNTHFAYIKARALAGAGRKEEAIGVLDGILTGKPTDAPAAIDLIRLLTETGRVDQAAEVARAAVGYSPRHFPLLMAAAEAASKAGRPAAALVYYEGAREIRPYDTDALYAIIETLRGMGRIQESLRFIPEFEELKQRIQAIEPLRQAAEENPGDAGAAVAYADRLFVERWLDLAVNASGEFMQRFPEDERGGGLAVRAAQATRDLVEMEAARSYAVAALEYPNLSSAEKLDVAEVFEWLGEYGAALQLYLEQMMDTRTDPRVLTGVARGYLEAGDTDAALAALQRALNNEPGHARALSVMGLLRLKQQDYEEAESYLRQALEKDPDDDDALFGMGFLAHQRRESDQAVEYLYPLTYRRPQYRSASVVLALALSELSRCGESIPIFLRVLEEDFDDVTSHEGLLRCYEQTGRQEEAAAFRERALRRWGTSGEQRE